MRRRINKKKNNVKKKKTDKYRCVWLKRFVYRNPTINYVNFNECEIFDLCGFCSLSHICGYEIVNEAEKIINNYNSTIQIAITVMNSEFRSSVFLLLFSPKYYGFNYIVSMEFAWCMNFSEIYFVCSWCSKRRFQYKFNPKSMN